MPSSSLRREIPLEIGRRKKVESIEDFSIPVIYSTCTSGAGVASGKRKARRKTVGRLVCTWRRRVGAPSLLPSLFMPSAPLATPYRYEGPTEAAETLNEEEARRVSGFGVGRQPNRASVGRRTRVPSLRPARVPRRRRPRIPLRSLPRIGPTDTMQPRPPRRRGATFSHPRRVPR